MSYFHAEETNPVINTYLQENSVYLSAGICGGRTTKTFVEAADRCHKPFSEIWGFDSFIGLPKETEGVWCSPEWFEGQYSALEYFKLNTVEQAIDFCRGNVGKHRDNVFIVEGFFSDTLTSERGRLFAGRVGFIDVDCDMHSSAYEFLDWACRHKIMREGCIVRFDDWICAKSMENNEFKDKFDYDSAGENLAFAQITEKYGLSWEPAMDSINVFIYRGLND